MSEEQESLHSDLTSLKQKEADRGTRDGLENSEQEAPTDRFRKSQLIPESRDSR